MPKTMSGYVEEICSLVDELQDDRHQFFHTLNMNLAREMQLKCEALHLRLQVYLKKFEQQGGHCKYMLLKPDQTYNGCELGRVPPALRNERVQVKNG